MGSWRLRLLPLVLCMALWPSGARAHDPSAWGGLFRTRDHGVTWFPANPGRFVSGAIALAVSPADVHHLLLGTDSGLLRSRNGARDWELEAPDLLVGPVFVVAFDVDGQRALASTSSGVFVRAEAGQRWERVPAPTGAAPARAVAAGTPPGRVWLAGWTGLYRSDDWGRSWARADDGLPDEPVTAVVVVPGPSELVYAIAGGRLWASADGGRSWHARDGGLPSGRVDAVVLDLREPARVWAAGADRLLRSDDRGERWQAVGRPLPEPDTAVRGLAVSGATAVVTTDRGLYRSGDGGERWELSSENLPAHLEAWPLVRDPADPATLYAGFGLTPYPELWRRAAEGGSALGRLDAATLAGGAALLGLLVGGAGLVLHRLRQRYYRAPRRAPRKPTAVPEGRR